MINVTKTYLPDFDDYATILKRAWDKGWVTNNGELVVELEQKLKDYLNVKHLLFCTNGTIVLQMALKVFNITKEVITTPFSYVATTNAILWEGCKPVFVDIDPDTFCIKADKIEEAITSDTQAILATHVYGNACDVEKIDAIATKYNLKVIYDGAHAFGSSYKGKSLLRYGDISTCSFHATKLFHTVEGGCIISNSADVFDKLFLYRQFGHTYDDYISIGVNAKNSELHAAMGLSVLPKVESIIRKRKSLSETYDECLSGFQRLSFSSGLQYNYSHYPILFINQAQLMKVIEELKKEDIIPRRYFFPSLNTLPYITYTPCLVSEDISKRILCLPLYHDLPREDVIRIAKIIKRAVDE